MRLTWLLIVTVVIESGAGLVLLLLPAVLFALLLGVRQAAPEALLVGRLAGAALLAIGVASWWARHDSRTPAQIGLLVGILIYNVAAVVLLGSAGAVLNMVGVALWPAVVLHAVLAVWCFACLRGGQPRP